MNSERNANQSINAPANSSPALVSPEVNASPTTQVEAQQQLAKAETNIEKRMTAFERSTLRWTMGMFAVTLVTSIFIALQWWEIRTGSVDTHALAEAAKVQAEAAKAQSENTARQLPFSEQQARAAQDSVRTIQQQIRQDERAWVGMTRGQVDITIGQPLIYTLEIKNTGKTPAFGLQSYTHFDQLLAGTLAKHELPWKPSAEQILHPGQENDVRVRGDRPVSQTAFDTTKNGQSVLWIRTQLRYKDAFEVPHRVVICSTINPVDMHSLNACPPGYQYAD